MRRQIAAAAAAVTGTGAAAGFALAFLVLVCVFVAVAVPRASVGYRTAVLQRNFRALSSTATSVLADATISGLTRPYPQRRPAGRGPRPALGRPAPRRPPAGASRRRVVRHGQRLEPVLRGRPGPGHDPGPAPAGAALPQRAGPQRAAGRRFPARRRDGDPPDRRHPGHRRPVRPAPRFPAAGRGPGHRRHGDHPAAPPGFLVLDRRPGRGGAAADPARPELRALPERRGVRVRCRAAGRAAALRDAGAAAGDLELPPHPEPGHRRSGGWPGPGAAGGRLPARRDRSGHEPQHVGRPGRHHPGQPEQRPGRHAARRSWRPTTRCSACCR